MIKCIKLEDAIQVLAEEIFDSAISEGFDVSGPELYMDIAADAFKDAETFEVGEDYISRKWLLDKAESGFDEMLEDYDINHMLRDIKNAPSVVPSRAEGEWKITNTYKDHSGRVVDRVEHTDCGYIWNREMGEPLHNYCPNCGAKMKSEE